MKIKEKEETKKDYSPKEKLKAAYALNMCTVSVSQIVDYNDSYILEQEYDAILNNLNLEQIPKDDALLKTLVELLNTITFFRIQEIKKKQIEKKYQEQMKNAIWNAIKNPGVIVTSGNPIAIAVSLATQIGAGYMNYRKTKAQISSTKADSEIELQITAIEQFNALKRELFTTAWRLAEKYGFDDKLRLTEKQINQYNEILMDGDDFRKYARLEAIQDKFQAYPPFWYFFGHTALYIADASDDEENRAEYIKRAKECFTHYEEMNEFSILREDHLTSSFALEFIDLLMLEDKQDKEKIIKLLNVAIENAGNEFDVLQLCAITALRIGDRKIAGKLLKELVNEDYNKTVNAQILSCIYVQERNYPEYEVLGKRIATQYLFPMPAREDMDIETLTAEFEATQRKVLKEKFKLTLRNVMSLYAEKMNRKISVFELGEEYDDEFFADSDRGKRIRRAKAGDVLSDEVKKGYYLERLKSVSLPVIYTDIIDDMLQNVLRLNVYRNPLLREKVWLTVTDSIQRRKDGINSCQERVKNSTFNVMDYDKLQNMGICSVSKDAFDVLFRSACKTIDSASGADLMSLDGNLFNLCNTLNISMPEISTGNGGVDNNRDDEIPHLSVNLFGSEAYVAKKETGYLQEMSEYVKKALSQVKVSGQVQLLYRELSDLAFDNYFNNSIFDQYPKVYSNSVAVLKHFNDKYDFIFTTEGIVYLRKGKVGKKVPYEEITLTNDRLNLWGLKVKSVDVDLNGLYGVIRGIAGKYISNSDEKHEYVGELADPLELNQWFRVSSCASIEGTEKVYALPKQEILDSLDIHIDTSSVENCLLQFIYDTKNGLVLEYRILEFEQLNSKFRDALAQNNGVIRLE